MNLRLILVCLSIATLCAQHADNYRVAGRVVDSVTGAPLARVRVSISPSGNREQVISQVTRDDGRFLFDKLRADKYHLTADRNGSSQQVYGEWLGGGFGTSIVTGPGESTEDITFRYSPPAVISGRVLDDAGEPVRNALVQLLMARIIGGRRRVVTREWLWTKDLGEYRFSQLSAGSYYIVVTARPWFAGYRMLQDVRFNAYAPAFYPDTKGTAGEQAIQLKAGEEAAAEIRLTPANGATINVTFPQQRFGEIQLIFHGIMGNDSFQASDEASGGLHAFNGVPPGRYTIRARWNDKSNSASISPEFEVNGTDITVDLSSTTTASINGVVQVDSSERKSLAGAIVSFVDEESFRGFSLEVRSAGDFTAGLVPAGRYRIRVSGVKDAYVKTVSGDGVSDGLVTIGENERKRIQIVLTSEVGRVKGKVFLRDKPAAGAFVVLAPEQPGGSALVSAVSDRDRWKL